MNTAKSSLSTALLVEGVLVVFLGIIIRNDLTPESRYSVLWSFLAGAAMVVFATLRLKDGRIHNLGNKWLQQAGTWLCISPFQAFLFTNSLIFTILAIGAAGFEFQMRSPYAAVISWLIGIALAMYGGWNRTEKQPSISKRTILWLAAIITLAFLIRGIAIDRIPVLFNGDEASGGINATDFIEGGWNNLFITGWFSFPSFYFFLQSLSLRVLGQNVEALRIPSAVIGALTVGVVYLCGKAMFGRRAGLFSALILACLHFHIHFSRQGLNNIWDSLWFTLTIALVWYGWKYSARWAYILAGASLGFSQYFYASSKALIVVLFISAVLALAFRSAQFRQETPHLVVALMVALAIVLPLAWFYLNNPGDLLAPFARVSIVRETISSDSYLWEILIQRIPDSLGAYTAKPLAGFYSPGAPILRPLASIFFYLGIIFLLFYEKDSRFTLLTLWLVAFAFINGLSYWLSSSLGPVSQRYVASAPACALIAGYGLDKLSNILMELWPKARRLIRWAAYMILVSIMVSDLLFYFAEFTVASHIDELDSNGMAAYQAGNYLKDQPAGTEVIIFGTPRMRADSPAIGYLAPKVHVVDAPEEEILLKPDQFTSQNLLFMFLPEYKGKIETIQNLYPGGILTTHQTWLGGTLFWVYEPAAK